MKFLKYATFVFSCFLSSALHAQTQTSQITAALVDLGNESFKVTFTPNNALAGTPVPLNIYLKVPEAQLAGTSFTIGANPYGLAFVNSFANTPSDGFGYFFFQTQTQPPIGSWATGTPQDIITLTKNGTASEVSLSGGDFGSSPFPNSSGFFWPGTALTVDNTSTNLVSWPIASSLSFLPVEMSAFRAILLDNRTSQLDWRTETETGNQGFDIERSFDGHNWKKIGYHKGNGTTLVPHDYRFIDDGPRRGINYYRLRQMDFDGQFEYSQVRSVDVREGKKTIALMPNPATEWVKIQVPDYDGTAKLVITDQLGRLALDKVLGENQQEVQLDLSGESLQGGIYLVTFISGREKTTRRLVIED